MNSKNLIEKVKSTIENENMIQKGDKIVLAVSGGPDSICMLDILNKIIKRSPKPGIVDRENLPLKPRTVGRNCCGTC